MELQKAIALLEILGDEKQKKSIQEARRILEMSETLKNPENVKRIAMNEFLQRIAPDEITKKNIIKALSSPERKIIKNIKKD